jgi:hypothetical protein
MHLIIPFAAPAHSGCRALLPRMALPQLARLLARLAPVGPADDAAGLADRSLALPHERAQARSLDLPDRDGQIPWAAWQLQQSGTSPGGQAWARFTPCHWAVGSDHVAMRPPEALQLADDESRALLEAMAPYFTQDGLTLQWQSALHWRACGDMLRELPCASLDRVVGRAVDDWLPRVPQARPLRRLQQEMQMLLYTHPVNEARERAGRLPVNSFWVDGAGALPAAPSEARPSDAGAGGLPLLVDDRLRQPALQGDAPAWQQAWEALDAQALPPLLEAVARGAAVRLTLAGERAALTLDARAMASASAWQRLAARWRPHRPADLLSAL